MASTDLTVLMDAIRRCRRCINAGHPIFSSPVFSGCEGARVMLIGQAPGITEAEVSRPFNGTAGRRLFRWLADAGFDETDFRARHYMTSVTKCYPGKARSGGGDRVPSAAERALCAGWLSSEIALVNPEVIIPVGRLSIGLFFSSSSQLAELIGSCHRVDSRWLIPLPHPSGASRWHQDPDNRDRIAAAIAHLHRLKEELVL